MIIDLMRHGDTGMTGFRGRIDDALTPAGWAQMQASVQNTANATPPWQYIFTSPRRRCAEFASMLSEQLQRPMTVDARLAELDFGDWDGLDAQQLMRNPEQATALRAFWQDPWHHPPPGGESMAAFEARLCSIWNELASHHAGQHLLLITHAGIIRMARCLAHGLPRTHLLSLEILHASLHRIEGIQHLHPSAPCSPSAHS